MMGMKVKGVARETVGSSMMQKSRIQCYNCKEFGHVAKECQKPKRAKDAAYHREKMLLCKQEEAGIQLSAEQADWKDDTDDESDDQELEAHYMYMAKVQEVSSDAFDSGPIFDTKPEQKIDQNDEDADLAKELELLASLIEKLKCEIDERKNRNKFLETSNKVLVDKLKSEIEDFKKNKSLELSYNQSKEANNKLSKENNMLYADYEKSQAELVRRKSKDDDQSFFDEDLPKKIYSNPLFDEEIIPVKIDPHPFNAESDLIESMLNHDSSIISSSKSDSLFDEFAGELTFLKSIPPRIDETDCHPKEETHFTKRLLYDNLSPRLLEEIVSDNSDADIESFSPYPILIEDSNPLIEEIDLSLPLDDPMAPSIEEDDYDSKRDIPIFEELLDNYSLSL
nr:hypothetical protein [Tanacetum cinerariifolium]